MKVIILCVVLLLCGCGAIDRAKSYLSGNASEVCMSGVLYYQFTSGSAVSYNQDGSVRKCKN